MTQEFKFPFPGLEALAPFAWPKGGATPTVPTPADWLKMQQELVADIAAFVNESFVAMGGEIEQGAGLLQRLMAAKTPEDLVAWQQDMLELVSSKYVDRWAKLAERMRTLYAKGAASAAHGADPVELRQAA